MEWKDECRISEAFPAAIEKQNNHEDRIQAIEEVIAKTEELIVEIVMALQKEVQCPFEQLYHNLGVILEEVPDGFDSVQEVIDWIVENTNLKEALKDW